MQCTPSVFHFLKQMFYFRLKRWYTTFYYSQYNSKLTLLLLFPLGMSYVRYNAETKYGYHIFINTENATPETIKCLTVEPSIPNCLKSIKQIRQFFEWRNGSKIYLPQNASVEDLKRYIYKSSTKIPDNLMVGCKGRVFNEKDNLAAATRIFCKRDPYLVLWKKS
jgi:hypothetical protein